MAKPESKAFSPGLDAAIRFSVDSDFLQVAFGSDGPIIQTNVASDPGISISAPEADWQTALAPLPPPIYQSFSAIQLRNSRFKVEGDPLAIAQARAFLEAVFANLNDNNQPANSIDLQRLQGDYHRIHASNGQIADIFAESAGNGSPILCLHTAGADTRQFHGVMCDPDLGRNWRLIGFDMPHHGRSMPPAVGTAGRIG